MARPTTEKICIVCGKPFLPTGGRQLKCKRCGGKQRKKSGLEQAVQNADAQGISYGKYMSTKHKEEKTMAVVTELFRSEDNGTLSFGDYTLAQKAKKGDIQFEGDIYKIKTFKTMTKLDQERTADL